VPEHARPRSSAAKAALSETIEHKLEKSGSFGGKDFNSIADAARRVSLVY
jgi:hypothetical protein